MKAGGDRRRPSIAPPSFAGKGAGGLGRHPGATLLTLILVLALAACPPAPAIVPTAVASTPSPAPSMPPSPTLTPSSQPTVTPIPSPTPVPASPTASPTPAPSPTTATIGATATPTSPARLATDVLQAAEGFRAGAAALGQPSSQQLSAAQDALSHAATWFAASGAVGNAALEQQFAAALKPTTGAGPRYDVAVLSADLDGDGKRELLVSARLAGLLPLLVPGGQPTPQPLAVGGAGPTRGVLTTIGRVLRLSGSRSGILVTQVSQGASATNTRIQVVAWDGARQGVVFDQGISDWAGPARWDVTTDRQIQLT